ncbi:CHASE3 domain-containing protein [Thauera phenylacetica]
MPSASATPSRPSTPVLLAVLALVFVLGVSWILHGQRQTKAGHAALEELEAHAAQLARLDALLLQVLEAESGARAYVMSGDEHYLAAYIDGRERAGDTLAALHAGFAADPAARAAADELADPVERRWLSLDQLVAGRGSGSVEAATLIAGSAITTDIRARIEALRAPLRTRMEGITRASFERSGQARSINSVLGVAIIALLLVIGGLAWRQEELRGRIAALLRTENARLQAEVDARTADLTSLAGYLSETREAEHARLAAELHDEFGPLLSAVRMDAVWITRKLPAEALEPVRGRFDHLLDALGRVVFDQAPHRRRSQTAAARRPRARRGAALADRRDGGRRRRGHRAGGPR